MEVKLFQVARHPVAVVRRRASILELPRVVPESCGVVWTAVKQAKLPGAGRNLAIYWDDKINLEVGVEMASPFPDFGEVKCSATPAGPVATATHFGPYNQLPGVHQAIRQWCADHGHTLPGPNWEIYGHWDNAWNNDPSKIRTDVFYLLTS